MQLVFFICLLDSGVLVCDAVLLGEWFRRFKGRSASIFRVEQPTLQEGIFLIGAQCSVVHAQCMHYTATRQIS
jgi:hypothetical protein